MTRARSLVAFPLATQTYRNLAHLVPSAPRGLAQGETRLANGLLVGALTPPLSNPLTPPSGAVTTALFDASEG